MIELTRSNLSDDEAHSLIAALNAEPTARYPEAGANHFRLDPEEVAPGRGAFLVARIEGEAVGCGAVRLIEKGAAEIKRMYTKPEARGKGVARTVLEELERIARALGASRLLLETGERQEESLRLYERAGFERIPPYDEYIGSPLSVCMGKALS